MSDTDLVLFAIGADVRIRGQGSGSAWHASCVLPDNSMANGYGDTPSAAVAELYQQYRIATIGEEKDEPAEPWGLRYARTGGPLPFGAHVRDGFDAPRHQRKPNVEG